MTTDDELWARARDGDADAFAAVFDRHVDRVHRHARRFTGGEADAEDVTAIVFLEAWRLRRRVRVVDGSVIAWLLVTATNTARNVQRGRVRYERALRSMHPDHTRDHADDVIDALSAQRVREPVRAAFGALSRADQEVLALCVIEELRPREVATLLRVPSTTVRARLSRAKRRLKDALEAMPGALDGWQEA